MKSDLKFACATLVLMLLVGYPEVSAQSLYPYMEYKDRVSAASVVSALRPDVFGEKISLYDQQVSFEHTDVSLPGNNDLQVSFTRTFAVEAVSQAILSGVDKFSGAGDWDIAIAHISGTFDEAYLWNDPWSGGGRCSTWYEPTTTTEALISDIWSGYHLHIPGRGTSALIANPPAALKPTDGVMRVWTTSHLDAIKCKPMLSGLPGEGFIVQTQSGITYFFDIAVIRRAGLMLVGRTSMGQPQVRTRKKVYILASRVEDRFGNWVTYTYNAKGHPTKIQSSDGRIISATYLSDGNVSTVIAGGRVWTYAYSNKRLTSIVNPDGSSWGFEYLSGNTYNPVGMGDDASSVCTDGPLLRPIDFNYQVRHPTGGFGTFNFAHVRHYRSGVPLRFCESMSPTSGPLSDRYRLVEPFFHDVLSLREKMVIGPGLPTGMKWTYADHGGYQPMWFGMFPPCTTCTSSKVVTVTHPDGSKQSSTFGIIYGANQGKLLGEETKTSSGMTLSSSVYEYVAPSDVADTGFPDAYGTAMGGSDPAHVLIRPLRRRTITQDGVEFRSVVEGFDTFARPVRITKSSTPLP